MSQKKEDKSISASLNCSITRCCSDENNNHMLTCCECTRSVHYRCTQLPAYQIQAFLEKRIKRHFHCSNCIFVPEELQRIVNPISKKQQEINQLKREIKRCENITKISEENTKLTRKIVQEQLAKFNEKGLDNYIDKKFKDLTENLSDSIKNQQHSSQKGYSEILATLRLRRLHWRRRLSNKASERGRR